MHLVQWSLPLLVSLLTISSANSSNNHRRSRYGCEGTELQLTCEPGTVISPVRANYGRFSIKTCNPAGNSGWSTRCIQPTSLRQVSTLCAGQTACSIDVTSSVFGDPCPGTYKYLEVHYTCVRQEATAANSQQQAVSLLADLPPWLLKMTATSTSRPLPVVTVPTTSATTAQPSTSPAAPVQDVISLLMPEVLMLDEEEEEDPVYEIQDVYRKQEEEIFINLPQELEVVERMVKEEEEQTVLVATLVSLLSCCLVILAACGLLVKHHQRKAVNKKTMLMVNSSLDGSNSSLYRPYTVPVQNNSSSTDDWYEYCSNNSSITYSSSSSIGTTIYTTLPNGQLAIIVPMTSNNSIMASNSMLNSKNSTVLSPYLANPAGQSCENYYVEIGNQKGFMKY